MVLSISLKHLPFRRAPAIFVSFFSEHPIFAAPNTPRLSATTPKTRSFRQCSASISKRTISGASREAILAPVPKHADAATLSVDRFLAASGLRLDGTIAFHSALELHGCAYTETHDVQAIALARPVRGIRFRLQVC